MPPKGRQKKVEKTESKIKEEKEEINESISRSRSKKFDPKKQPSEPIKTSVHRWAYGNGKTPNSLTISSWNVNGLRPALSSNNFQKYLETEKPDILCINETKIDELCFSKMKLEFEGYHGYWNFCKCSAGYSGVAILSKHLPISMIEDLPENKYSYEGRVITLEFENFILVTVYMPSPGVKMDRLDYRVKEYDQCFYGYCEKLKEKNKTVILCGDFNVLEGELDIAKMHGKKHEELRPVRDSFQNFLQKGWVDSFRKLNPDRREYSFWGFWSGGRDKDKGQRIDYFLVDENSFPLVKDSRIRREVLGSDHCPIELKIDFSAQREENDNDE